MRDNPLHMTILPGGRVAASQVEAERARPDRRHASADFRSAASVGRVAVGNQRGSALHVGLHESFDRRGGIVRDPWRGGWARARIEVFHPLPARLGSIDIAINHLDGADDEDFPGIARIEERTAFAEEDSV